MTEFGKFGRKIRQICQFSFSLKKLMFRRTSLLEMIQIGVYIRAFYVIAEQTLNFMFKVF